MRERKGGPAEEILHFLLREGPMTVKELQSRLGLSSSAVRLHLQHLQGERLVTYKEQREGVGRPTKVYMLTDKARASMANHSESLALTLLEEMWKLEDAEKMRLLLDRVSRRLAAEYGQGVRSSDLYRRVEELRRALNEKGVIADVQLVDNKIIIHEYVCPYHDLAQEHRAICEMDEAVLSQVLGSTAVLSKCMMDGAHGCVFEVTLEPETVKQ